jgi:hypothetical protein
MTMIGMVLDNIAERPVTLKGYVREQKHSGLSSHRWDKIISLLTFDIESLLRRCNAISKRHVKAAPWVSLDETIWPSEGGWPGVRDHPEKPIKHGMKVFNLGFRLPVTKRSWCWHFFPDHYASCLKPAEALDCAVATLDDPQYHVITADRWFGSVAWLQAKPTVRAVFTVKHGTEPSVFDFMTQDLYKGEYRVFKWKNALVSLHNGIDLNIVVSTAHVPQGGVPPRRVPVAALQAGLPPRFTPEQAADLANLKFETLQSLARRLGESGVRHESATYRSYYSSASASSCQRGCRYGISHASTLR